MPIFKKKTLAVAHFLVSLEVSYLLYSLAILWNIF